jgi:hypothetical protein
MNSSLNIPTASSLFTDVRYFGPLDPYFYTVDNRPLSDLDANTESTLTGPVAALMRSLALSQVLAPGAVGSLFSLGTNGYVTGLTPSYSVAGSLTVAPGALYVSDSISSSVATTVTKLFARLGTTTLNIPAPGLAGQSINYLVQLKKSYMDATTMASSSLPFVDSTNAIMPGLVGNGELTVSIAPGSVSATTGSQTTPSAESGAIPLYVVTVNTAGAVVVTAATSAPNLKSRILPTTVAFPAASSAGTATIAGNTVATFADGSTTSVNLLVPFNTDFVNPYLPLKVNLTVASSVASGAAAFQVTYLALGAGDLSTAASVTTSKETVNMSATANAAVTVTTSAAVVPNTAFSGFSASNIWSVSKNKLFLQLSRVGADSADTNTGLITLLDVSVSQ